HPPPNAFPPRRSSDLVAGPSADARAAQTALGAESLNEAGQRRLARSVHPFHSDDDLHDSRVPPISPDDKGNKVRSGRSNLPNLSDRKSIRLNSSHQII